MIDTTFVATANLTKEQVDTVVNLMETKKANFKQLSFCSWELHLGANTKVLIGQSILDNHFMVFSGSHAVFKDQAKGYIPFIEKLDWSLH